MKALLIFLFLFGGVHDQIKELYPTLIMETLGDDPYEFRANLNVSEIEGGLLVPMAAYFPKTKTGYLYRTILNCEKRTLIIEEMTTLQGKGKTVKALDRTPKDIQWKSPASYVALKVCK